MSYNKPENRNKLNRILGPGIWVDADDNMHFNVPDLLKMVDLQDTPENREKVTTMVHDIIAEYAPDTEIIDRETPDD